MPAVSPAQRALFAIAEHHPDKLYSRNASLGNLSHQTLHDFAATTDKGLPRRAPKQLEDGGMPRYFAWKGHSVDGSETMFPSAHVSDHGIHRFAKSIDDEPKDHFRY